MIYEEAASDNSNVAFDGQQSANNQLNSSANLSNNTVQQQQQQPGSKIAIQGNLFKGIDIWSLVRHKAKLFQKATFFHRHF